MPQARNHEILSAFRSGTGKERAFGILMNEYKERLYWHIRKILISHEDTDDALQNTFVKVWKSIDGFREESNLFTWLYRIATNEAITLLHQKRKRSFVPWEGVDRKLSETLEADEYFSGDQLERKLQKAVLELPEKQRIVFTMKYFDEMKYEDMAEILQTSEGALKASYHHAVKKIEKYMNRY